MIVCATTLEESMSDALHVVGIAGSLRAASYNRGLLRAAVEAAPAGMTVEAAEIRELPIYDADLEAQGDPAPVAELKRHISAADGLLIATPEYNYSIPGGLKNTIDWLSRPPRESVLLRKPVALMGASPGGFGTVRSQLALRQAFLFTNSAVLQKPELRVSRAGGKFDEDGTLTDEGVRDEVAGLLEAFAGWIRRIQAGAD
jgi:chromate reductase